MARQFHGEAHSPTIAGSDNVTAVSTCNLSGDEKAQTHVSAVYSRGCSRSLEKRFEEHLDLLRRNLARVLDSDADELPATLQTHLDGRLGVRA